jgi:hypothetical protein
VPADPLEGVALGHVVGNRTSWSTHFMAAVYRATPGQSTAAADQITDEQVLVSQSPPTAMNASVSIT